MDIVHRYRLILHRRCNISFWEHILFHIGYAFFSLLDLHISRGVGLVSFLYLNSDRAHSRSPIEVIEIKMWYLYKLNTTALWLTMLAAGLDRTADEVFNNFFF
jgi:hypothetical protein